MRLVLDNDIGNGNGVGFRNDNDDDEDDNMWKISLNSICTVPFPGPKLGIKDIKSTYLIVSDVDGDCYNNKTGQFLSGVKLMVTNQYKFWWQGER